MGETKTTLESSLSRRKEKKKYVEPAIHMPVIMNHIQQEATKKGGTFLNAEK